MTLPKTNFIFVQVVVSLVFFKENQTVLSFQTAGTLSEEHKQKIRKKALGRKHSDSAKQKMLFAHKGKKRKPLLPEHRQKISQGLINTSIVRYGSTEETRQKQAASRRVFFFF